MVKGGGTQTNSSTTKRTPINPERLKYNGPKKTIDGKEQFWCPLHICPNGTYRGLYCGHTKEGHDEWQKRKDFFKAKKKGQKDSSSSSTSTPSTNSNQGKTFQLTDRLKTALCTEGQMSAEQVEAIFGQDF